MIPQSRYNPRLADQLKEYLLAELSRARSDRQNLEKMWMRWHRMYRARPDVEHKTFPWEGAANIVVPLIGTNVDIVYARLMAMLFGPQNLWTCTPLRDDMVQFAPRLQEMLQWAQNNELGVYDAVGSFLLDMTKLGTGVLKTRYTRETKKVYEFREMQTADTSLRAVERQARIMIKNHPSVHHVSLPNFYIPATANDVQSAPWVGERLSLTWSQYVNRVRAGIYSGIENVGQFMANTRGGIVERNMQTLDSFIPSKGDRFEPFEFWLDWDIDGDGEQEALVCTIHEESRSYLRIDYNPFFNQEKPYDYARYMKQENRFYGIGIAEMLDHFQEEITTMHNQRIDNTAVQTAQVLAYRKGGPIKQDTPIYPGAKIPVEDPATDLKPLPLGNGMATSSIPNEQMSLQYAKERVGVNDYISGGDDPSIGYGTATTAVQQLREGSKRFDQVLREVRQCLSGTGTKVAELYQQFNQQGKQYLVLGPKDGETVSQILSFPLDLIRSGVNIDVTATSASYNKEVEARTNMMIMQQLTQYYGQLLQYMQLIVNPQLPPQLKIVAEQAASAGSVMLRRLLDTYGTQDAERLVPDLQEAINGAGQQLGQLYGALGANGGAAPMVPPASGLNGMAVLPTSTGVQARFASTQNGTGY